MKTLARIEVEFPTALFPCHRKAFLMDPADARQFTEAAAVAGVKIVSQTLEHLLNPTEVAADIAKERRIAAELAGNALTTALNPQKLLG